MQRATSGHAAVRRRAAFREGIGADGKKPPVVPEAFCCAVWLRGRVTTDTDIHYKSLSEMEQSALGSF